MGKRQDKQSKGTSQRLTQRQLAARLGLSPATVSLALRNSPLISAKTRKLVAAATLASGYVYNRSAASLRTQRTHIVGVSFHDIVNPFFAELLSAIEAEMARAGRTVVINSHGDDKARQGRFLETLREYTVDGLLLSPSAGTRLSELDFLLDSGMAVVTVSRGFAGDKLDFAGLDDKAGLAMATRHLIQLGHRRIAMLGGNPLTSTAQRRHAGWRLAMRQADLGPDPALLIPGPATRAGGLEAVRKVLALSPQPTAIACMNDLIALGVLNGLRHAGLEPGRDIAVVGCDDVPEAADAVPPLTSVVNRPGEMGAVAARMLLERITEPGLAPRRFLATPALSIRASSGPALRVAGAVA